MIKNWTTTERERVDGEDNKFDGGDRMRSGVPRWFTGWDNHYLCESKDAGFFYKHKLIVKVRGNLAKQLLANCFVKNCNVRKWWNF